MVTPSRWRDWTRKALPCFRLPEKRTPPTNHQPRSSAATHPVPMALPRGWLHGGSSAAIHHATTTLLANHRDAHEGLHRIGANQTATTTRRRSYRQSTAGTDGAHHPDPTAVNTQAAARARVSNSKGRCRMGGGQFGPEAHHSAVVRLWPSNCRLDGATLALGKGNVASGSGNSERSTSQRR